MLYIPLYEKILPLNLERILLHSFAKRYWSVGYPKKIQLSLRKMYCLRRIQHNLIKTNDLVLLKDNNSIDNLEDAKYFIMSTINSQYNIITFHIKYIL